MASLPLPKEDGLTYGDYRTWPEDGRWELIDGTAYDMSPAPALEHQRLVVELVTRIHNFVSEGECQVFVAPFDVRLPRLDEADAEIRDVVQPDILVVRDPEKLDRHGCRGAPDWVVEITSPATAARDHIEKQALYERSGVREYWLVHPEYRIVTAYRMGPDGRFGRPTFHSNEETIEPGPLPGLSIDLKTVFDRPSTPEPCARRNGPATEEPTLP